MEFPATVQNEFRDLIINALSDYVDGIRNGDLTVQDLSAINTVTDEASLQHSPTDSLPDTALFNELERDTDYPSIRYDSDDPPDFQLIKVTDGEKVLMGIQNHRSLTVFDETKKGIPLLYQESMYTKFAGDLLIVPDSINAVSYDGDVFVRSPKSFEKMFEMRDEYEERASEVFDRFDDVGIKFARDKLTDEWLVSDIRVLRKLYTIHENEITEHATPEEVKNLIVKYDVDVEYDFDDDELTLDVENYFDIWKLLRVLNADYAEAEIIPARLEIQGKRIMDD